MSRPPKTDPAAMAAVEGEISRAHRHALPVGTPCANCDTPIVGSWCHACGQKAEDLHRSVGHLVAEAFEGLTHFDGRFWNTVPRLARDPGGLTRDYVAGKRASQIPPFRLFLVMLLVLFFSAGVSFRAGESQIRVVDPRSEQGAPIAAAGERVAESIGFDLGDRRASEWLNSRVRHAVEDPESLLASMEHHAHEAALLMLPLAALLLGAIFVFRRGTYLFDHLIFSMHSLSFQGLLLSAVYLLGAVASWSGWLLLIAPVHLFAHLRGAYGGSVPGTLLRMVLLFAGSLFAFGLLAGGLLIVGLAEAH